MAYCSNCGANLVDGSKFCANCGAPAVIKVQVEATNKQTERRSEFVGSVRKCPACGGEITSFTAICPSCGHEINSQKVSDTLGKFIAQVNACERMISQSQTGNTGWSSWSTSKKVWWVIFNILFACIPLAIYWGYPLITIKSTPRLTKEEKQLASLIENYTFPNDRESIIEGLVYAKEKIDFISKEKIDKKSAYWMRLWCSKSEQLKQKADLMFPNDNIVKQSYAEILADEKRVNNTIKFKAIAGAIMVVAALIFMMFRNGTIDTTDYDVELKWQTNGLFAYLPEPTITTGKITRESEKQIQFELYKVSESDFEEYVAACREAGFTVDVTKTDSVFYADNEEGLDLNLFYYPSKKILSVSLDSYNYDETDDDLDNAVNDVESEKISENGFEDGTYENLTVKKIVLSVPDYWEEEGSKNEYLQYYAEKGDKVAMLSIAYPKESDDDYEVTFKGLYEDNDNMVKAVEAMFTDGDVVSSEEFETDYGIKGMLYKFTYNQKISWSKKVDGNGYCFCFPSETDRRWFYVVLLQTNNIEGDKYKDDYMKIIATIRTIENK